MPFPTQQNVIEELERFRAYRDPIVVQNATELLTAMLTITSASDETINNLTSMLLAKSTAPTANNPGAPLATHSRNPARSLFKWISRYRRQAGEHRGETVSSETLNDNLDPLVETRYRILQVIAFLYPRNNREEDTTVLDPITLTKIEPSDLFISIDRYHWSITQLFIYVRSINDYINPFTRQAFTPFDIETMNNMARIKGISLPECAQIRIDPVPVAAPPVGRSRFSLFSFIHRPLPLRSEQINTEINPYEHTYGGLGIGGWHSSSRY